MRIESDIQNANGMLVVFFYKKSTQNEQRTLDEGRPIFENTVFIKKMVPGDQLSIIDRPMYESDKNEFPMQWAHFQNKVGSDQVIIGTPLVEWPLLTTAQAEELRAMKFYTVENVAEASDAQIMKLGMMAGMSPHNFRDKAKAFLNKAKDVADDSKRQEEIDILKQELAQKAEENAKIKAETEAKLATMQEQMTAILAAVGTKKTGRKPKAQVEE
jgi:DNA-binding transcriptional regulator of glucitol operon